MASQPLVPITFAAPGTWGINTQEETQPLDYRWATRADNLVIDRENLLRCRGAFRLISTDPATNPLLRVFNYVDGTGTEIVITTEVTTMNAGLAVDLSTAGTDVTSSTAPTAGYWQLQNFNGKVVGWQTGHAPIVKTSGDFADITAGSGSLPTGDVVLSAFGRLWAVDSDRQTIKYSALLDETLWAASDGAGSIGVENIWTRGMDQITGLAAFSGHLVVFGREHIILFSDGQGAQLGVDPDSLYVVDVIEGTGCVARDSIANVGEGDLVFCSEVGVQSMRHLLADQTDPLQNISWQIKRDITAKIEAVGLEVTGTADYRGIVGRYSASTRQYFLMFSGEQATGVYVFHMDKAFQDMEKRYTVPITTWDADYLRCRDMFELANGKVYFIGDYSNDIYEYDPLGTYDPSLGTIEVDFESGWVQQEPQSEVTRKMLKSIELTVDNPARISTTLTAKHQFDFTYPMDTTAAVTADDSRTVISVIDAYGRTEGQYFKFGLSDTSFGGKGIQAIKWFIKPGKVGFVHDKEDQVFGSEIPNSNGNIIVAVGTGNGTQNASYSTDDGVTWTAFAIGAGTEGFESVDYSEELGLWVAVGSNQLFYYATDPTGTWTQASSPPGTATQDWYIVRYSKAFGRFYAGSDNPADQDGATMAYTTDGNTWTEVIATNDIAAAATASAGLWLVNDLVEIEETGRLIAVGSSTLNVPGGNRDMYYTDDGDNWFLSPPGISFESIGYSVTHMEHLDKLVASGGTTYNALRYSTDGGVWWFGDTSSDSWPGGANPVQRHALAYSPQIRIIVAQDGTAASGNFMYSHDAETWTDATAYTSHNSQTLRWLPYSLQFMSVGNGTTNFCYTSSDGVTYTAQAGFADINAEDVAEGQY